MALPDSPHTDKEVLSQAEVERLLDQVAEQENSTVVHKSDGTHDSQSKDSIQPCDFRCPVFLSPNELRKLRVQHEAFVQALAARLSIYLRLEFSMQMSQLQTVPYQKFVESLGTPCHLTLFKVEPLRGICILDISPRLGLAMIDRLMGGPGLAAATSRDLSEIEMALLDQVVHLVIGEWCSYWSFLQELRPMLLGHENSGRFLQTSQPDAVVLALSMEARIGECVEQIQIGFPYSTLEPLIRSLSQKLNQHHDDTPNGAGSKPKWSRQFDDLKIGVHAEWSGLKLTARQLTSLKEGDVLPLPAEFMNQIGLRLVEKEKFQGRLGTVDDRWAVEITKPVTS